MKPAPLHHPTPLPDTLRWAVEAAHAKQAASVVLLDLRELGAFADFFLICTGGSSRQIGAVREAIEERLEQGHVRTTHREGRSTDDWVLLDYGRFVVHIFTERARLFYDLERLWRAARRVEFADAARPPTREKEFGR